MQLANKERGLAQERTEFGTRRFVPSQPALLVEGHKEDVVRGADADVHGGGRSVWRVQLNDVVGRRVIWLPHD
jgi:hypothetical protein